MRPGLMPSEKLLALHELHCSYESFDAFQPDLPGLLQQGGLLDDCITLAKALGILEPLSGEHVQPEALLIQGPNWRESLIGNGLLSRNRGVLWILERLYGSLGNLKQKDIYLAEAVTGFSLWLRRKIGNERILCSEYLLNAEAGINDVPHQDLCELTFSTESFDLIVCNELFEHVQVLDPALAEICRVLRPGGRLVATCPLAFGQRESIVKAIVEPTTGKTRLLEKVELHGDPVRPDHGSLVYRIPGWEVLEQLKRAGMVQAKIHHVSSWKHGILGSDLPGILVVEAQK